MIPLPNDSKKLSTTDFTVIGLVCLELTRLFPITTFQYPTSLNAFNKFDKPSICLLDVL